MYSVRVLPCIGERVVGLGVTSPCLSSFERMTKALRMSTMFLRTLREDPADADVVSDKLLQRACYLR